MYTTVFYKENTDGTFELVKTEKTGGKPHFKNAKHPFYVQVGEFDGVVDPSKGIDARSNEQKLEAENVELKNRVQSLEQAMDFVMEL